MDTNALSSFLAHMQARNSVIAGSEEHRFMHTLAKEAQQITQQINTHYHESASLKVLMEQLTGKAVPKGFALFPPLYTDCGKHLTFGENVFINSGCCFQDQGGITIGNDVCIGHQVVFATLNHELNPNKRGNLHPAPIHVGNRVWIGSHATILAGVTIHDGAVIAAGAVVHQDVAAHTVVGGVPAKVIKQIEEEIVNE